jgi:hypothetical protein
MEKPNTIPRFYNQSGLFIFLAMEDITLHGRVPGEKGKPGLRKREMA